MAECGPAGCGFPVRGSLILAPEGGGSVPERWSSERGCCRAENPVWSSLEGLHHLRNSGQPGTPGRLRPGETEAARLAQKYFFRVAFLHRRVSQNTLKLEVTHEDPEVQSLHRTTTRNPLCA